MFAGHERHPSLFSADVWGFSPRSSPLAPGFLTFLICSLQSCLDSLSSRGVCDAAGDIAALFSNRLDDRQDLEAAGARATLPAHQLSTQQHRAREDQGGSQKAGGTRRTVAVRAVLRTLVWHYIIAVTLEPRSRADSPDSRPGVGDRGSMVWSDCKVWVDPPCRR